MKEFFRETWPRLLALISFAGILIGGILALSGHPEAADKAWAATITVMLVPLAVQIVQAFRRGAIGVDTVAFLSMTGSLLVGEYLAGAIVSFMYSGGDALDAYAAGKARHSLAALLRRAPQTARLRQDGEWTSVPVSKIMPGDRLLVRTGDLVPVDGILLGEAIVNESLMTGESLPVTHSQGELVRSGTTNAGSPFEIKAEKSAEKSSYAALVRLVENAEKERAPFVRMADRYSLWFLLATVLLSGGAWLWSGDPVRAVAVLVVATPCPLILAAPIALIGGIARMTKEGVVVKSGKAIETLGGAKTVLLDKTGTLTTGNPEIEETILFADADKQEALRLAASVDQVSSHVLAAALVRAAREAGISLQDPENTIEAPGQGIAADISGKRVLVGSRIYMKNQGVNLDQLDFADRRNQGKAAVFVAREGEVVAALLMTDRLRSDAAAMVSSLHEVGLEKVAMVTGDHKTVAEEIARKVGLDQVYSEHTPEQKLDVVRAMRSSEDLRPVVMVGDGVNDAPALAMADVGIAMGAAGSTISAETADCVITVDRVDRVAKAIKLGRRTLRIAKESVLVGIGLSVSAMFVASLGYLPPVAGALLQEVIDVAVIVNALRVLR